MYYPIKEELEGLRNEVVKVFMLDYTNKTPAVLIEANGSYIVFVEGENLVLGKWRRWTISSKGRPKQIHPHSIDDIKTLIRILTNNHMQELISKEAVLKVIDERPEVANEALVQEIIGIPATVHHEYKVGDNYTYGMYCEYPHSDTEYEKYFGKHDNYNMDDWRNMMIIKNHSYHHTQEHPDIIQARELASRHGLKLTKI